MSITISYKGENPIIFTPTALGGSLGAVRGFAMSGVVELQLEEL